MKRLLLAVLIAGLVCSPVIADNMYTKSNPVDDSSQVKISSYAIANSASVTTDKVRVVRNVGFGTILITEDISGGAGDVDIYAEYSLDGTNFYRPCLPASTLDGTCTEEGLIAETVGNETLLIPFPIRMADWIRFVIEADANSEVTLEFAFLEDK